MYIQISSSNKNELVFRHDSTTDNHSQVEDIPVIENTGEILIDKSSTGKVRNWEEKKRNNLKLVEILKSFRISYPELLSSSRLIQVVECANYLKYGITQEGIKRLVEANFCRFKFCPICIWRKSLKMFSQVSAVTEKLNEKYPSARYIFVTLTVRNVRAEELSSTIDRLNEGFKYLVQKSRTMKESEIFKESLLGYIKAIEITYNRKTKDYHPHIHAIFHLKSSYFGSNYIKQSQWVKIWKSMMNLDYDPLVDVKAIKKAYSDNPGIIAEVSKYPIKSSDILSIANEEERNEVLATFLTSTYHRRFVTFGGTFREVKRELALDDIEDGSLVHVESNNDKLNYVSYELYKYDFKYGVYVC